ncbi:hypothetical protein [Asticcacaulis sp. EMRT-3]|uniref:hypothetical protein n=1 Tax=Asticcacaulis sp. EMRT-3 TaxID=3040349 RepID=UPI0024AEAC1E|nr:hypothetical protein [Asticcacaulis sp. EMRT-3]MDI7775406.1 hypothetical protein [Asticcacaulis sp. EMRT-3]
MKKTYPGTKAALKRSLTGALAGFAAFCLAAAPAVIAADAADAVTATTVSRYFLANADARCHALPDAAATALKAGYLQARNTALRAGHSMDDLGPWLARARAAALATPCDDPRLTSDFATADSAYRGFIAQSHLTLPGTRSVWSADRSFAENDAWRLVQYQHLADADLAFGLYGPLDHARFTVMAHFADGAQPYAARLLLRDADRVANGLIDLSPQSVSTLPPAGFTGDAPLAFMARASATLDTVLSAAPHTNLAGFTVTGDYAGKAVPVSAVRFDFPSRSWPAIARLDPREDMVVEFDFDDGPRYVRFEVGDFMTGLMYVSLPQPYSHAQGPAQD